ncbi:MAG: MFS transporter [Chloroflexi bacterium]|jgi:MFS family permease|nr:MFS transporter [Chloroflexota bacterium]
MTTAAPAAGGRPAQDWRRVVAVYAATSVVEAYGVSQVFAFMPLYLAQLGLPADQIPFWVGILGSFVFILGLPLVPLWGVWADKYSRKVVIIRSAVVEVVVFAGVALAREPWQFAIALLLIGLQLGNTGVMLAAIRDATPAARLGTAVAVFGAASGVGFALGPIVGGVLVDGFGLPLEAVYWSAALLTLAIVALLAVGSGEVRPERVPAGPLLRLAFGAVRGVFTDRTTVRLFGLFFTALLASQMARPYVPLLVTEVAGTGAGAAGAIGFVTGIAALVGALVSPVAGGIGDRVGFRPVLAGALAATSVTVLLMPLAPDVPWLAAGYAVVAGCQAATSAMVFGLLALEVPSDRRSATLNLVYLPLYAAGIIGPAIGAVVAGVAVGAVFAVASLILAGGAVAAAAAGRGARIGPPSAAEAAEADHVIRDLEAEVPAELR